MLEPSRPHGFEYQNACHVGRRYLPVILRFISSKERPNQEICAQQRKPERDSSPEWLPILTLLLTWFVFAGVTRLDWSRLLFGLIHGYDR